MRVYLVRHGEAKSAREDPERSLSERGVSDVRKVARALRPLRIRVGALLHSGKARARQTAELLGEVVEAAEGPVERPGLGPSDAPEPLAQELRALSEDVLLVGHLPFLGRLAALLLTGREAAGMIAFASAGVLCLERGDDDRWRIAWMLIPAILG